MAVEFAELPGWYFDADEVSAGVFTAKGWDLFGRAVEATGTDPDKLIEKCRKDAVELVKDHPRKQ